MARGWRVPLAWTPVVTSSLINTSNPPLEHHHSNPIPTRAWVVPRVFVYSSKLCDFSCWDSRHALLVSLSRSNTRKKCVWERENERWCDVWREKLLSAKHLSQKPPGRGEELRTIKESRDSSNVFTVELWWSTIECSLGRQINPRPSDSSLGCTCAPRCSQGFQTAFFLFFYFFGIEDTRRKWYSCVFGSLQKMVLMNPVKCIRTIFDRKTRN